MSDLWTALYSCKRHLKSISSFPFPKTYRHYVTVLNRNLFLTEFYFQKKVHSDKSDHIFWKYIKNKSGIVLDSFLGFAHVSSYLTFKLSAWKRGSTIFWTTNTTYFIDPILERCYKVLPRKAKIAILWGPT